MKIIGKVSSSSLQHNVNRNFEERRQLKDQKSNQIEKLYAYHIILNSIQLVTGIPGGNIQLYVASSVTDLIFWIFCKEMNLTSHSWHHHSRCYNWSDLNKESSHFSIFTGSLDFKSCKRIEIIESRGISTVLFFWKMQGWTQWGEGGPEKDALLPKNHSQRGQSFNFIKKLFESPGFDESRTQWYWWWPWYSFDTDPWGRSARVNRQGSRSEGWKMFSHLFCTLTFSFASLFIFYWLPDIFDFHQTWCKFELTKM